MHVGTVTRPGGFIWKSTSRRGASAAGRRGTAISVIDITSFLRHVEPARYFRAAQRDCARLIDLAAVGAGKKLGERWARTAVVQRYAWLA
jgi:hypothetical protein